jgi:hypothetical protein
MNESEWLACQDPLPMLDLLRSTGDVRKLCLLACAWWHRAYDRVAGQHVCRIVDTVEEVADGAASRKRLRKLMYTARAEARAYSTSENLENGLWAAWHLMAVGTGRSPWRSQMWWEASVLDARRRAALVREVFGNPFRPVPAPDPTWLTWRDGAVRKLAVAIYDDRRFENLPILADALEEAGCDDADILTHCRSGGEHARGCWVVDLLRPLTPAARGR